MTVAVTNNSNDNDEEGRAVHASYHSTVSHRSRAHHHHIEIATLTLPAKTGHSRVDSEGGSTFVLEAPSHVIDHLLDSDQHTQSTHEHPHIEGVVDLDMVSHLVSGVTEEEFSDLLQQDVVHTQHDVREEPSKKVDEESQLLRQSTNDETSCLVVPSDPFTNVIAEFQQDSAVEYAGLSAVNELKASSYPTGTEDVAVTREAYLLSIPTDERGDHDESIYSKDDETTSKADNVFVLAVPEVAGKDEMSLRTSVVTHSTIGHTRREELQSMIENAFAPLPTDVQHIELRVSTAITTDSSALLHKPAEELHLDLVVDRKVPLIGYIILVSGLFALSSIGVAFDLQEGGVTPEMKAFWRFSATAVMFLILSFKSLNREEFSKFTPMEFWVWVPFAGVNYGFMCTAFVVALDMTSLVNAFILSNLASLIIIGSKFVLGSPVLLLEGTGAAIGMTGALICAYAGSEASGEEGHDGSLAMLGNILAFLASVATALYLTVAKTLRPRVDLFVFMLFIFTYAAMSVLLYMVWAGQPYELSTDATIGLFGWLRLEPDRLPLELWMAIICNLLGTTGYIAIMKYFDPVVVSMVMLMEPIVASLMGAAAGVSTLPGLMTWAGDGVVVVGSILVILSGSKKTETIDATKALHTVNEELVVEEKPGLLRRSSMSTKTPTLKRSVVLRSPTRHMIRKDRANTGDESMEFVFVGNKSRGDTAISSLRDSRHKVAWN